MTAVLIMVGALVGTGALLTLFVWLVGRAEDRHEAREREAMRDDPRRRLQAAAPSEATADLTDDLASAIRRAEAKRAPEGRAGSCSTRSGG